MWKTVRLTRFSGAMAAVVALTSGCVASATPIPTAFVSATPSASSVTPSLTSVTPNLPSASPSLSEAPSAAASAGGPSHVPAGPRLIVLADGVNGGLGLWTIGAGSASAWTALGPTPGATALGRTADGIAVATGHDIDFRPASALADPGTVLSLRWPGVAPTAPVVGLAGDPAGRLAIVTADAETLDYFLSSPDGTVTSLTPAPTQTFMPLIAWLDETRLLVLNTDNQQVSRLADVDVDSHTMDLGQAIAGVDCFGLSGDRQTVAVSNGSAVYAGSVTSFMGRSSIPRVMAFEDFHVAWALAPDTTGDHIFMLSGTVTPDGQITSIHELGYARQGSGWTQVLDSPAPFTRAIAQVYLP